jgi:tetratricopeptide (TPR) repeat protein
MVQNKHSKLKILSLIIIITFFITACGSSNKVTYRVTGEGISTANIVYNDANGNKLEELVDLPWEMTIGIDEGFDAILFATNPESTGEVTCGIWLNENELGQASSAINVQCFVLKIRTGDDEMNPFLGKSIESTLEHTQKLVEQGKLDKALEYANNAIEAAPNYSGSYVNRAVVYAELDDLDAAKADLLKIKELSDDPDLLKWVDDKLSEY